MKVSSTTAVFLGFTGFILSFIVGLSSLNFIAEYVDEPRYSLGYTILLMAIGVALMVFGERAYRPALAREKRAQERQQAWMQQKVQEDLKAYFRHLQDQEKRVNRLKV
jgi:hypothetical protein